MESFDSRTEVSKTKVAVACQGGGSQTAFTAGALTRILRDSGLDKEFELVALSGTSGGAVCCLLGWYGLLAHAGDPDRGVRAAELITSFWEHNSAHEWWDQLVLNPMIVGMHRLEDGGWLPALPPMPGVPAQVHDRLRGMLEQLVRFDDLPALTAANQEHPTLLCGAVDVLSGEFTVFEEACPDPGWRRELMSESPPAVSVETVLASAAVPPLMPAVAIGDGVFWDGMFSNNPPVRDLVDRHRSMRPDEIWVIQIDPETCDRLPDSALGTVDRRFELSSNLSLNGELHWIRQINQWVDEKVLPTPDFKIIRMAQLAMSPSLAGRLDLASKVDRDPGYLHELVADGSARADAFLAERSDPESKFWLPDFPHRYTPGR